MPGVEAALGIPVVFVLAIRLIMSVILQSENRNADSLLKGLIQGILLYHAFLSTNQTIAVALLLGIGGRMVGDFITSQDSWKVASTLLGIAFGVLMADVVSYLFDDKDWNTFTLTNVTHKSERSHRQRSHRRVSEPRRIEEMPGVSGEASSLESHAYVARDKDLSDIEKEVARLRAKALHAAGQRRRFREERKWALSQGNLARAFQLRWQVKKYHALAASFTREADEKLLQDDRVKRRTSLPPVESQNTHPQVTSPFVQVVVEGGRDIADHSSDSAEDRTGAVRYQYRTPRNGKEAIKSRPDVFVNSQNVLRSERHNDKKSVGSPPTSDTWSRQLD